MDETALLGMLAQLAGGIGGDMAAAPDREAARRVLAQMMKEYGSISAPELQDVPAEELGDTALAGIQSDPRLRGAQDDSLGALKRIQDDGGLTLEDRAVLNRTQNQLARRESAGRASIANDFAARGQLGSGAQLAMSLQNQQDSANRAAEAGMDTAASAQRRYFDSVLARGRMAGDMDDRDYGRKASAAQARDLIARHNAAARTDARRYSNDVKNQKFSNQMALAGGKSGAGAKQANYLSNEASRTADKWARTGDAAGKFIAGLNDEDEDE